MGNQITVQSDLTNDLPVSSTFGIDLAGYPHQSVSDKLLRATTSYNGLPPLTGGDAKVINPDPYRSVPNMDRECLECHRNIDQTAGVGKTF